jgi:hypothetical protein
MPDDFKILGVLTYPRLAVPKLVEPVGIEPTTPCLQSRCSPS